MKFWVFDPPMMVGPWAFADVIHPIYGDAPRCPSCGAWIGMKPWLPPFRVRLVGGTKSTAPADVMSGPGMGGFIASQRFVTEFLRADLRGIERWDPVAIKGYNDYEENMLSSPPAPTSTFKVAIMPVPTTRAVWAEMHPVYTESKAIGCQLCGPRGRIVDSYRGVIVDEASWTGADIFELTNLGGPFIVTEAFKELIASGEFIGVPLVPAPKFVPFRAGDPPAD